MNVVLSTTDGIGKAATTCIFYKRLASLLSEKWDENTTEGSTGSNVVLVYHTPQGITDVCQSGAFQF